MTDKEQAELAELRGLRATGQATKKQILRCLDSRPDEHASRATINQPGKA